MIRALIVAAAAFSFSALAACSMFGGGHASQAQSAPTPAYDACNMAQHQNLIGVDENAIDESTLPAHHRVVCFGCMATMDFVADRLTIQIGPGHKVASMHCG